MRFTVRRGRSATFGVLQSRDAVAGKARYDEYRLLLRRSIDANVQSTSGLAVSNTYRPASSDFDKIGVADCQIGWYPRRSSSR